MTVLWCFLFKNWPHCVAFLLLLLSPASACPPTCNCSSSAEGQRYQCSGETTQFVIQFEVNVKAEFFCKGATLGCEDIPTIPITHNGYLPSLSFDSCYLRTSLACVMGTVRARAVGALRADNSSELTGSLLRGAEGLKELWILDAASQKTLPFDDIARIPTLVEVRVHNTQLQLIPPSAQNAHLQRLELMFNGIKHLPRGVFSSFKNLTYLLLLGNQIEEINEGAFDGLDTLGYLDLSRNPLTTLGARALAGAPRMRELRLHLTGAEAVRAGAFAGLRRLEKIDIKGGYKRLQFEDLALSDLPSLKNIVIEHSPLAPLTKDLFKGSKSIENITIISTGIEELPETIFADQIEMKNLKLNDNKIKVLPEKLFWTLESLEMLDLSGNLIEMLPGAIFEGLTNLEIIYIDSNYLTTIPPSTFNGPKNLIKLSLRNNLLTLLDDKEETNSPFANLKNLEELNLNGNRISRIFDDWRIRWVHAIKKIDLSSNRIRSLKAQDLQFFGLNITIDLQNNNISTIEVGPNLHTEKYIDGATFILDNNPMDCNCSLHPFLYFTRNYNFPKFSLSKTQCDTPNNLAGQTIQDLPLDSLTCNLKDCPEDCSCISRTETSTIELDCLETPLLDFPDPKSLNLTKSKLRLRSLTHLSNLPGHVVFLDLSNLSLTELPVIPNTVSELDLRFNKLTDISDKVMRHNLTVYLGGNNIKCDCWNKIQIEMLNKRKHSIRDYKSIKCDDGSYLHRIVTAHMCDMWWATVIGCSLAAVGVIAAVAAGVIYYNVRKIQKFIYKRGWPLPPGVYEDEIDNKTYDVLISYSDAYEKFAVSRLVPLLKSAGYTVCLRCVEWDIGDFLPYKVPDLVEKSRRVVVLLSSDYFDSEARLELRAALMNEKRSKRRCVLLVVTKDLESDSSLDKFLQTRKNLDLHDESFWERLKNQLPRKRKQKNRNKTSQRTMNVMMTAEQKMMFSSKLSLNQL